MDDEEGRPSWSHLYGSAHGGYVPPVLLWRLRDAPGAVRDVVGGREGEWVALVPPDLADSWMSMAEGDGPFKFCSVARIELADGGAFLVGMHT